MLRSPLHFRQLAPQARRCRAPGRAGSHVEYKYVVRNEDGSATAWKPGDNLELPLQGGDGGLPGALRVSDAWDAESWRSVEARP